MSCYWIVYHAEPITNSSDEWKVEGKGSQAVGGKGGVGKRGGRKGIYCSDGLHVHLSFTDAASELATRDNDDTSDSGIIPDYRSG